MIVYVLQFSFLSKLSIHLQAEIIHRNMVKLFRSENVMIPFWEMCFNIESEAPVGLLVVEKITKSGWL